MAERLKESLFLIFISSRLVLKPIVSWFVAIASLALGLFTVYELFTNWVPSDGWTTSNLASIGFTFFMIVGGATEIGRRLTVMLSTSEASKRCGGCGAMMPQIAKFCRECGKSCL